MHQIAYIIIAILLMGGSPSLPNLELGERVPAQAIRKNNQMILVSPAQFQPMWIWKYEDVEYTLGADDDGFVQFILTSSTLVSTPEGVRVGQPWGDLGNVPGIHFGEWPGWGRIATLPSGWKARCSLRLNLPDEANHESDIVDALFNGTAAGFGQRFKKRH